MKFVNFGLKLHFCTLNILFGEFTPKRPHIFGAHTKWPPFFSTTSYTECPLLLFSSRYLSSLSYSSAGVGVKNTLIHFHHVKVRLVQVLNLFLFFFFIFFPRSSIKLHLTAKSKISVIKKTFASHNHAHWWMDEDSNTADWDSVC